MNFAKYRVQLSTEKKYSSKYEYKYEYEYSIPDPNITEKLLTGSKISYMYKRARKFIQQVEFLGLL